MHDWIFIIAYTAYYTIVLFFWIFVDIVTFKRSIFKLWALFEILTMTILGISSFALLEYGPYTDRMYSAQAGLTATTFKNIVLISNSALAVGTSLTCLLLVVFSLWATIFPSLGWSGHFAHEDGLVYGPRLRLLSLNARDPDDIEFRRSKDSSMLSFLGPQRAKVGADDLRHDFLGFMYRRNVFLKYRYEYLWVSIVRGSVSIYLAMGLVLYFVMLGYQAFIAGVAVTLSTYHTAPTNGLDNITIVATQLEPSETFVNLLGSMGVLPVNFTAHVSSADGTETICQGWDTPLVDAFLQSNLALLNCNSEAHNPITKMNISYDGYPSNATAYDVHSSPAIWLVSSPTSQILQGRIMEIQRQILTRGSYKLLPAFHDSGLVALGMLKYGTDTWLTYSIEQAAATASFSGTSSSLLLRLDPSQILFFKQKFQSSMILDVFQVFSSLGGIFTVVSGTFAVVFGRSLQTIFAGGESLFHIGLLGQFKSMRKSYQDRIQREFPFLQPELRSKGLASLFASMASDASLFRTTESQKTNSEALSSPYVY